MTAPRWNPRSAFSGCEPPNNSRSKSGGRQLRTIRYRGKSSVSHSRDHRFSNGGPRCWWLTRWAWLESRRRTCSQTCQRQVACIDCAHRHEDVSSSATRMCSQLALRGLRGAAAGHEPRGAALGAGPSHGGIRQQDSVGVPYSTIGHGRSVLSPDAPAPTEGEAA